MEQLVDTMLPEVQVLVSEHKPKTVVKAAELADGYFDARKGIQNDFEGRPKMYPEKPEEDFSFNVTIMTSNIYVSMNTYRNSIEIYLYTGNN